MIALGPPALPSSPANTKSISPPNTRRAAWADNTGGALPRLAEVDTKGSPTRRHNAANWAWSVTRSATRLESPQMTGCTSPLCGTSHVVGPGHAPINRLCASTGSAVSKSGKRSGLSATKINPLRQLRRLMARMRQIASSTLAKQASPHTPSVAWAMAPPLRKHVAATAS